MRHISGDSILQNVLVIMAYYSMTNHVELHHWLLMVQVLKGGEIEILFEIDLLPQNYEEPKINTNYSLRIAQDSLKGW